MPCPGEDRSDVGGTAQFNNIGPVPLSAPYGKTTLQDLNPNAVSDTCKQLRPPKIAITATDSLRQERVAFTAQKIFRMPVSVDYGVQSIGDAGVPAQGVPLFLAVIASSCFPPVFRRLRLRPNEIGVTYNEFMDTLSLNDGGVVGNLGIEVFLAMRTTDDWDCEALPIICDAERPQTSNPWSFFPDVPDLTLQGQALSHAAR